MSDEKPDLESPGSRAAKDAAVPEGNPANVPPLTQAVELRGVLTAKSMIAGVIVATIMGATYPYMVLKLGFGPNVSVVAAFFGFLFLRLFDLGGGTHYNRWQNNLVEAAGTSGAQTAFMCVLLGAFDLLYHNTGGKLGFTLTPWMSFLWLSVACTLGVLLAVPMRRHFIVDEKLAYPDGMAAAETVLVMDPPKSADAATRRKALAAFRTVMWGLALSGVVMVFREDTRIVPYLHRLASWLPTVPEGWNAPWKLLHGVTSSVAADGTVAQVAHGIVLANLAVGTSYSLLSVGSGMIVGLRITVSMFIGGVLAWVVAPYLLVRYGVPIHHVKDAAGTMIATDTPTRTEVLFWVMWPATGILVAGGLTSLALRWRLLIETFRSLRTARIGTDEMPLAFVIPGIAVCAIALCAVQAAMLGMPVWMTITAIVLSVPLMLVGLRVLGETNWGPISALSNMMQGVFAAIAPGNVVANMVASGTTGTISEASQSIMQDYRAGQIIGTKPRYLTVMQLIGVPIGAAAVSWMYPALVKAYRIVDTTDPVTGEVIKAGLTSPISNKWAGFAQLLQDGVSSLPTSAFYALIIASVAGVVMTVLESRPGFKKYIPSPTAMGIGIIVPLSVVVTMVIGGIAGAIWERKWRASSDVYQLPLASGLIAGEALIAVLASIFLAFAT